jgi:PAS domain S-box-containing protein
VSLTRKALLAIALTLMVVVAALLLLSSSLMLGSFAALEDSAVRRDVARALFALKDTVDQIDATTGDWAAWDDTYAFIDNGSKEYEASNLLAGTYTELSIDFMAFIDRSGKLVYGKLYDPKSDGLVDLPVALAGRLGPGSSLLAHKETSSRINGLIDAGSVLWLVASRPILTSLDAGPIRGSVVFGRRLAGPAVERLAKITQLQLSIEPMAGSVPESVIHLHGYGPASELDLNLERGSTHLIATAVLGDIDDRPVAALRIEQTRDIYAQGRHGVRILWLSLLIAAAGLVIAALMFLRNSVIAKVEALSAHVFNIGAAGDPSRRIAVTGGDELGGLGAAINEMLNALERSRRELGKSRERLEQVFENSNDAILLLDARAETVLAANATASRVLGYEHEALLAAAVGDLWPARAGWFAELQEEVLRTPEGWRSEEQWRRRDGTEIALELSISDLAASEPGTLIVIARDITERRGREAEVARLLEENVRLAWRSITVEESERQVIARELHDDMGQSLAAIRTDAAAIAGSAAAVDPRVKAGAEAIMTTAGHIYDVVRAMLKRLRPELLDTLGLVHALRGVIGTFQTRHPELRVSYAADPGLEPLPEGPSIAIYRVLQEALTNIARHAQARRVEVVLAECSDAELSALGLGGQRGVKLSIEDDGRGFTSDAVSEGLGLVGMRERVRALGGRFSVVNGPDKGVRLTAIVPVGEE